jgi:hypothetical protein
MNTYRLEHFLPAMLPLVEERTRIDRFENMIREMGVANACEYFGHEPRGQFASDTILHLMAKYDASLTRNW